MLDLSSIASTTASAVGAILLSGASVMFASAPAHAASPAPATMADWQSAVESQIDARLIDVAGNRPIASRQATVSVGLDGAGQVTRVGLAKSTGRKTMDDIALRTAARIAYPAMPGALAGKPVTVAVQIYFGNGGDVAKREVARTAAAETNQRFADSARNTKLATR